jgi:hypothetical protein
MARIALIYFDAGGGHRSTATSIRDAIQGEQSQHHPQLVNLQEILDEIDIVRRLTGIRVQDVYNQMLRNEWTLGAPQIMRVLQAVIRAYHRPIVQLLTRYWRDSGFDMAVSFVPHFNRAMCESFAAVCPDKPFVTVLTDFADYPPHFWIERQEQFLVCGSEKAVLQARQMGHRDERVFRVSGMVLNRRFHEIPVIDRVQERLRLGLEANRPTGIVLFGGQGAGKTMLKIDRLLRQSSLPIQLIFICGKNNELREALQRQPSRLPRFVEGFTTQVPYYMQLADFFIGKPGPGSVAEAIAMHLPVLVERNAWTLPQERYNTEWIEENQVGVVVRNFSDIAAAVSKMVPELPRFRRQAAAMQNRALFEVVDILKAIADRTPDTVSATTHLAPVKVTD